MRNFKISNLSVAINTKILIENVSFSLKKGDVLVILGQNGAGKTTLLKSIMNHFTTRIISGNIEFNDININNLKTWEIAKMGAFYAPQYPIELEGIQTLSFLRMINDNKETDKLDFATLYKKIQTSITNLSLPDDIIQRDLNVGFSGGQKKKNEVLQGEIFEPKLLLVDEIDSGLDVDSVKMVAKYMNRKSKDRITIVTSHDNNFLKSLNPTKVIIMSYGKIVASGTKKLIDEIDKEGFSKFTGIKPRKMLEGKCQIHKK